MLYTPEEKKRLKDLLYQIYPDIDSFPGDSVTPTVHIHKRNEDSKVTVLFLGAARLNEFAKYAGAEAEADIKMSTQANGGGRDLIINIEFQYPNHPVLTAIIPGDDMQRQQVVVDALKASSSMILWVVAHKDNEVVEVMELDYDAGEFAKVFDELNIYH